MDIVKVFGKPNLPEVFNGGTLFYSELSVPLDKVYLFKRRQLATIYKIWDGYPAQLVDAEYSITGYCQFKYENFWIYNNPQIQGTIKLPFFSNSGYILHEVSLDRINGSTLNHYIKFIAMGIEFDFDLSKNGE